MTTRPRRSRAFFISKRAAGGFTLLEMVLGGMVAALVGLLLFQLLANGIAVYRRAQLSARVYLQMFKAFDSLDTDLAAAIHFDYSAADPQWRSFTGNAASMRFVVRTPQGLRAVAYQTTAGVRGRAMIVRTGCPLAGVLARQQADCPGGPVSKGLAGPEGLRLSFAREAQAEAGETKSLVWQDTWSDDPLPAAVKVSVSYAPAEQGQPPVEFGRVFYLQDGQGDT